MDKAIFELKKLRMQEMDDLYSELDSLDDKLSGFQTGVLFGLQLAIVYLEGLEKGEGGI